MKIKKLISTLLLAVTPAVALFAEHREVASPDGNLVVSVADKEGRLFYEVSYHGRTFLAPSRLGLRSDVGDFTQDLIFVRAAESRIDKSYTMTRTKTLAAHYVANRLDMDYVSPRKDTLRVTFCVSNNDIAFRYSMPRQRRDSIKVAVVYSEATAFNFPKTTTTFLCPQRTPMEGWMRTSPSYEEEYKADEPMTTRSKYGLGFTFPGLFHLQDDGWALVSETGVTGGYCGSTLSDYNGDTGYTIAYPDKRQNNGFGSNYAAISLPGSTPWRTITVGADLKPIVETTIPFDVVDPLYAPSTRYKPGRYTWSWLLWQDPSINYNDQVKFIDLAHDMGYEYVLVDNWWDKQIGRERMAQLSRYAQSRGVALMLWYNSNGYENDAPQSPRNCMNNAVVRESEMAWLKSIGVKGIKVDFFGGDKQETMKLYEDILVDANRYGLQVIFHGCTLQRGWERMYPNYASSEAVLASENLYFDQHHCDFEGFQLTLHPFVRNTVGAMDWGGVVMNRHMSRDNRSGHIRRTSDLFEVASGVTNQSSLQGVLVHPNNLEELPGNILELLKRLPATWDETRFIDGYPGKYVVLARRHGDNWYIAGLNGTNKPLTLSLRLPMLPATGYSLYTDRPRAKGQEYPDFKAEKAKPAKEGKLNVTLQPMGGMLIVKNWVQEP